MRIEPRLVVEIGHINHQRIALPVAARIAVEQLDRCRHVRPSVERDHPVGMVPRVEQRHHPRRLIDLEIEAVIHSRHTHRRTAIFRLDVGDLRRGEERVEELALFRARPGLVRNLRPRRGIDNQHAPLLQVLFDLCPRPATTAAERVFGLRALLEAV